MSLYPIKLLATPESWRLFSLRKADSAFLNFCKRIFGRDEYTCQFCGFQARQHQEIINLDGNYRNNKVSNLVTSCVLCTQCFFLDSVGKGGCGGGTLVYLPEMTQNQLNAFCHVLFCAMANATAYRDDAKAIYRTLKLRAKIVEDKLGEEFSNPALLGQMLIDSNIKNSTQVADKILQHLRLLPARDRFNQQIIDWAASAMDEMEN